MSHLLPQLLLQLQPQPLPQATNPVTASAAALKQSLTTTPIAAPTVAPTTVPAVSATALKQAPTIFATTAPATARIKAPAKAPAKAPKRDPTTTTTSAQTMVVVPLKPEIKSAGKSKRSRSKKPLETKDPSKMTIAELSALFDNGIELPTMVAYHDNNFKKPISEQTSRVMVKFKPERFYHSYAKKKSQSTGKICIS
jgi:hypothetical protein